MTELRDEESGPEPLATGGVFPAGGPLIVGEEGRTLACTQPHPATVQNITFHIHGVTDPKAAAVEVLALLRRSG
jgi:hypothetical protein